MKDNQHVRRAADRKRTPGTAEFVSASPGALSSAMVVLT